MTIKTVAIVGGGPAGLTAAYQLALKGIQVKVFEASDNVGGMARTIPLWGQMVDYGSHRFFSNDPRVNRVWLDVIGKDYSMVNRLSRIYYRKTFFDYPLKAFNALKGLGMLEATYCVLSYLKAKVLPEKDESTFEAWVSNRFGYRLFTIFFKSYSEKLWGISCKELDAEFAAQRIKKLSLFEAIKSAVFGSGGSKHKTLVDEFAYPHLGTGAVYEKMSKKICLLGGEIALNTPVESVHPAPEGGDPCLRLHDGTSQSFDHIISSMPITTLVERMGAPDDVLAHAQALIFRNTILVFLQVEGESPFPDQWIYVHSPDLSTGRITNFRNWVPTINQGRKDTIICLEYWCYEDDDVWTRGQEALIEMATQEAYKTSLIPVGSVKAGKVVRVPKCYPVYSTGYREHLEPVEQYLAKQQKISVIGRYGAFKYNNQDHSILMGLLAAENIADGKNHNLWEINTDYEYQESGKNPVTGLSKG
ncbi:MAG: FAD-dependent oxidoreductase [Desulfobacteraceae bacterium]|nr:FAD-dependent oxidoreductase [Desulfobacteraceae bacterium]MBU4053035.1 FAD-dependent oxidoreductase [Pseudomonadota bacterium]